MVAWIQFEMKIKGNALKMHTISPLTTLIIS